MEGHFSGQHLIEHADRPRGRAAVLIFADGQQRDCRRRALPACAAPLLSLPRLGEIARRGEADLHWFTDRPAAAAGHPLLTIHRQRGRDFGQRLCNAVDDLAADGYDRVVIVGRDCPELVCADVAEALSLLDRGTRLVVGPDHRGGCWLIALRTADRAMLHGVTWQRDADAGQLLRRFPAGSAAVLAVKFDLDSIDDVFRLARRFADAEEVLAQIEPLIGRTSPPASPARDRVRLSVQLPPPGAPFLRCA